MKAWIPAASVVSLIIIACATPAPVSRPTQVEPSSPSAGPSLVAASEALNLTATPPRWFATLEARWTQSPSTILPMPTIVQTSTASPTPTLSPELGDAYVIELIAAHAECHLPCIFGIFPGESSRQRFEQIMQPVGESVQSAGFFSRVLAGPRSQTIVSLVANFSEGTNPVLVESIQFGVQIGRAIDPSESPIHGFEEAVSHLYLSQVLAEYGEPDRAYLRMFLPDRILGPSPYFDLILFYDSQGFAVAYYNVTATDVGNGLARHCFPPTRLSGIDVYAHSPKDGRPLLYAVDAFVGQRFDNLVLNDVYMELPRATGVSLADFYATYRQPTSKCIFSQIDMWGDN